MAVGRDEAAVAACGHHNLGDVDAAARVNAHVVRGEEIAGRRGAVSTAPVGNQSALRVENAYATAGGVGRRRRGSGPHAGAKAELGHVGESSAVEGNLTGPG